jgi:hypothetical protein
MSYFWVGGISLANGSVVTAGNWGRVVKAHGFRHSSAARELQFEVVRLSTNPGAPSRLALIIHEAA